MGNALKKKQFNCLIKLPLYTGNGNANKLKKIKIMVMVIQLNRKN